MPFNTLGLADEIVRGILAAGYLTPTDIQSKAIPLALEGKDLIGCAQTGTGKTAAFVLPILNRLAAESKSGNTHHGIRALVLTPTRELALQVEDSVRGYGQFLRLRSVAIYGGVGYGPQLHALARGVDIVVATPGRLIDLMGQRKVDLSHVRVFVLDEADRMFDMGFIKAVREIVAKLPTQRQTLLFSATMSSEVRALAASIQHQPRMIEVGERRRPVTSVTQHVMHVPRDRKISLLLHLINTQELDCVLVFSRTKHGADRISTQLERKGIAAAALHANRTQNQRQRALDGFKRGHYRVLVATDIAARGIDVDGISHVINFDTPVFAEDYIHRIGRTGRAAATGNAITFVSNEEQEHLHKIEKFIGRRLDVAATPVIPGMPADTGRPAAPQRPAPVPRRPHGHPRRRR